MISAFFQAFLRDWLWVFVSRGVGMSLADGVTGVVLADGGWLEARPACGPIGCPWQTLFGEYLPGPQFISCGRNNL